MECVFLRAVTRASARVAVFASISTWTAAANRTTVGGMGKPITKTDCSGCIDDFYNTEGSRFSPDGKCWSFDGATMGPVKFVPLDMRPPWDGLPLEVAPNCYRKKGSVALRKKDSGK